MESLGSYRVDTADRTDFFKKDRYWRIGYSVLDFVGESLEHVVWRTFAAHFDQNAFLSVVFDDRFCLVSVDSLSFPNSLLGIVLTLDQVAVTLATDAFGFGRIEVDVVGRATVVTDSSASESVHEFVFGHVEEEDEVESRLVGEVLGLIEVPWVAVENEAAGVCEGGDDNLVDDGVGDEFPGVHVLAGRVELQPEVGDIHLLVVSERVAGRDHVEIVAVGESFALRSLSCTWRSQQQHAVVVAHTRLVEVHAEMCAETERACRRRNTSPATDKSQRTFYSSLSPPSMSEQSDDTTTMSEAHRVDPVRETISAYESNPETYDYLQETAVAELVGDAFSTHLDGPRVLDAGCGPGTDLVAFESDGLDPVGFDRTEPFLQTAVDRTDEAAVLRADLRAFPFCDSSFDGVWCCASLLHLPRADASGVFEDAARILRPGGVLFVSLKHGDTREYTTDEHGNERLFTRYQPAEIRNHLADAGFSVEQNLGDDDWVSVIATLD